MTCRHKLHKNNENKQTRLAAAITLRRGFKYFRSCSKFQKQKIRSVKEKRRILNHNMHTNSVTYIEYETTITESCSCTCTRIVDMGDAELAAKGEKVKRAKGGAELLQRHSHTKKFAKFFHATALRKIKSLFAR